MNNLQSSYVGKYDNKDIKSKPREVPWGLNNKYSSTVQFELGQVNRDVSMISIKPVLGGERYEPPADFVNKLSTNQHMKLEMGGIKLF
jgi:hypothetical protein